MALKELAFTTGDGYTEQGYLKAVPGMHPDVRFLFRPMSTPQRAKLLNAGDKTKDQLKLFRLQAEAIIEEWKLLLEWNITDVAGKALPVTVESMMKLKPRLFFGIIAIITGTEPSDIDDEAPHRQAEATKDLRTLLREDEETTEEADAKNSETG